MATYLWVTAPAVAAREVDGRWRFDYHDREALLVAKFYNRQFPGPMLYVTRKVGPEEIAVWDGQRWVTYKLYIREAFARRNPDTGETAFRDGRGWIPYKINARKAADRGHQIVDASTGKESLRVKVRTGLSDLDIMELIYFLKVQHGKDYAESQFIVKKRPFWDYFRHYMEDPTAWIDWRAWWPFVLAYSSYVLIRSIVWSIRTLKRAP